MKKYAWAVTTWSGGHLVETIHSIPSGDRLLVIDNSQTGNCLSWSWNYAIDRLCKEEGYESVIICNDDIILQPDTGDLLSDALLNRQFTDDRPEKDRLLLIVTAYNLRARAGSGPEEQKESEGLRWKPHPDFSCFCTSIQLHETVGRFDEQFQPAYAEDNDMHRRIFVGGFQAMSFSGYFHYGGGTTNEDVERHSEVRATFDRNIAYYRLKWGGNPGNERFTLPFNGDPQIISTDLQPPYNRY